MIRWHKKIEKTDWEKFKDVEPIQIYGNAERGKYFVIVFIIALIYLIS